MEGADARSSSPASHPRHRHLRPVIATSLVLGLVGGGYLASQWGPSPVQPFQAGEMGAKSAHGAAVTHPKDQTVRSAAARLRSCARLTTHSRCSTHAVSHGEGPSSSASTTASRHPQETQSYTAGYGPVRLPSAKCQEQSPHRTTRGNPSYGMRRSLQLYRMTDHALYSAQLRSGTALTIGPRMHASLAEETV